MKFLVLLSIAFSPMAFASSIISAEGSAYGMYDPPETAKKLAESRMVQDAQAKCPSSNVKQVTLTVFTREGYKTYGDHVVIYYADALFECLPYADE